MLFRSSTESVNIAPNNAVSLRSGRTFDWRIVLHVMCMDGSLHEIISKMEAHSHINCETIMISGLSATSNLMRVFFSQYESDLDNLRVDITGHSELLYANSPKLVSVSNQQDAEGDYGNQVVFTFDEDVTNALTYPEDFVITDSNNIGWAGLAATKSGYQITVTYHDFNDAVNPISASTVAGRLMGDVVALNECSLVFTAINLVPSVVAPPVPVGICQIDVWEDP